jgi:hypothetical protein
VSASSPVPSSPLLDRLRARGKTFVLLAAWASAWLALLPVTLRVYGGVLFVNGLTPAIVIERSRFAWLHATFGWDIVDALFAAAVLAFVLLLVLLFTLETLAWVFRLDREDRPVAAVRWTLRALPAVVLWSLVGVVLVTLMVILTRSLAPTSPWAYAPAVVGSLWWLGLPFFALAVTPLRLASPAVAWRPSWPGWQAVAAGLVLLAIVVAADWATEAAQSAGHLSATTKLLAETLVFVLVLWPWSAFLFLWLNRAGVRGLREHAGVVFAWSTIAELLSLGVRGICLATLILGVPALVSVFLMAFIVPSLEMANLRTGDDFPMLVAAAVDSVRWIGSRWFELTLVLAPAVIAVVLLARGRLYVAMGRVRVDG